MNVARLFSGFDGAGEGIRDAGYDLSWAIEMDKLIADVARTNGHHVITADILSVDPRNLERPDGIHASPVCTNASIANASGEETQLDRDTAMKTVEFVEILRPRFFTLENVWQYRNFQSFLGGDKCEGILPALRRLGYKVAYWHLNAADYGVPQTRKRLILVASLDFVPENPIETHYNPKYPKLAAPSLFAPARKPWVGWYEAIEDLIDTLPDSQFAPWQMERLPTNLKTILVNTREMHHGNGITKVDMCEPCFSVVSTSSADRYKAFLVHPNDMRTMPIVDQDNPSFTVMSGKVNTFYPRAFLVAGGNATHDNCARLAVEPAWTVGDVNRPGNIPRAWLSQGRVVKMTTRVLARFQSFSDSYKLSGSGTLDCKGIGNACPPLLFKAIYEQIKNQLEDNEVQQCPY
jgi:DNA-cytosine methyltransferase